MRTLPVTNAAHHDAVAIFYPLHTVRCDGPALFRNQFVRDVGCLLDLDETVVSWSCRAVILKGANGEHRPDVLVMRSGSAALLDAVHTETGAPVPGWVEQAARRAGYTYETVTPGALPAIRLRNARDLLRYARWEASLSDRVRLLAALDEHGSLTVTECLTAFTDAKPIAGLASLVLQRFITMELDETLIGPETQARRWR